MSTQTKNLELTKPDVIDKYDINVQNENMDKIDTFLSAHASDTTSHITSEERTAWNNMLNSSGGTAERATADAEGNNIIDTYATKASLAQNIATTNRRRIDFEDIVDYFENSGSKLILTGFLVDNLMSISVSGYVDENTAVSGANVKLEQLVDSSVFGGFFKHINIDVAVPMNNGTVRTAVLSVQVGDSVITEFTFTKNGQEYKSYNYNDYGNDSSYELKDMQTYSGVSMYFQNMLDSTFIKYPVAINVATSRIVD